MTSSLPILNTAYQTNISTSTAPVQNSINFIPIAPNTKTPKTITLMCGNKSFTLTGGTFHPGTQYVLTKLKGKPTALMLTDQKKVIATNEPEKIKIEQVVSGVNQSSTVPSTSQQSNVVNQQLTSPKLPSKKVSKKLRNFLSVRFLYGSKYNETIINIFIYSSLLFWENSHL